MSFRFGKSIRLTPSVLHMLSACASPSPPSQSYQEFLANRDRRIADAIAKAKGTPRGLAEQKRVAEPAEPVPVVKQPPQVPAHLIDLVNASAPIAARAAQCGYWDGEQWYYEVTKVDVKNGLDGALGARFVERFNHALETGEGDGMGVSCTFAYNIALDYLVLWGQAGD